MQLTNLGGVRGLGLNWSPDGRLIAFGALASGNADIYVLSAEGGSPRRLTTVPSTEIVPSWSRDGQWIYFVSNRTGRSEVWKMPAAGGEGVQLTHDGGTDPAESPDSQGVYFIKGATQRLKRPEPGLWQVSSAGGEETRLVEANLDTGNWAAVARGIYFLDRQPGPQPSYTLKFFDFATHQTKELTTLEGPKGSFLITGLTLSPDEHWVLYGQRDKLTFNLMLVENLR